MKKLNYQENKVFILAAGFLAVVILLFIGILAGGRINFHFKPHNNLASSTDNYSELDAIRGQNQDFGQLTVFFKDLANKKGGEYAYKALAFAANSNYLAPNIDTHLLGHVVGDVLFAQEGLDGIKVCTNDLRNACSHSIVVGALLTQGLGALPKAVETCHLAPGGSGAYTMCVHGLGHGVLAYTNYDMKKAIQLCDKVGQPVMSSQEYAQCTGGVTMEMMAGIHDPVAWAKQTPYYFSKTDPLSPCDMSFMPAAAQPMCYNYLTPHLFQMAGADLGNPGPKDFEKAFTFCAKLPVSNRVNWDNCYGGFGKEFPVLVNGRNVENVQDLDDAKLKTVYSWCQLAKVSAGVTDCMNSALSSLYWGGENNRDVAIRFCNAVSDAQNQSLCFTSLSGAVSYYIQDHSYRESYCSEIPQAYQTDCRRLLLL
ncbi:MAG: hypothetical protein WDN47_00350 [Candidatus Doudnabacteria bacterium]